MRFTDGIVEDAKWRQQWLIALKKIVRIKDVPILLMSATISPQFEHELWEHLDLAGRTSNNCVREIRNCMNNNCVHVICVDKMNRME
jgi:CRISPR/Cas system-associated endonuclease/helicase Cas3